MVAPTATATAAAAPAQATNLPTSLDTTITQATTAAQTAQGNVVAGASQPALAPLGPIASLPETAAGLGDWKILILCTAVNSFTQRVIVYLDYLGLKNVSVQIAGAEEAMVAACESWNPDLVICPFLTKVVPEKVFGRWITLVVHPGPPGDAGPSSLDWVLMGDNGSESTHSKALETLLSVPSDSWTGPHSRSHWGTIVFQANEHLDGGAIWAWEQYALPPPGTLTKAQLYQTLHSQGAITALITAMIRVYETAHSSQPDERVKVRPRQEWQDLSATDQLPFQGGKTHERPLLQSKMRKPNWEVHTAEDVLRIISASDSQPGAQLSPLTKDSKTSLFAYGAHLHQDSKSVPQDLWKSLGYSTWNEIPDGKIIATRDDAVFIKTHPGASTNSAAGIWITHGRIPKKAGTPLEPKIPIVQGIRASGHGSALEGVKEWTQETWEEQPGTWQEVYVRSMTAENGGIAQCVYWQFYNGAFSTRQCQMLVDAMKWATDSERGNVKVLALMGGSYFSNGIALNTIEASQHPGQETWANINGIDDIVEFLVSDTSAERSPFMKYESPLCEKGIVTVACVRGNAAAGGVAFAASCDVVMSGRGVVFNPAYRAMGLHGSEFHSYSYRTRCGEERAGAMLREMMPQSSTLSQQTGLVDIELGSALSSAQEIERLCLEQVHNLLSAPATCPIPCAPWSRSSANSESDAPRPKPSTRVPLTDWMSATKRDTYRHRTIPPLVHFRNEELSQMLLDSFHPVRSKRYHERRYKFIRKVKSDGTPSRYANHIATTRDEEELESFDDAPGWVRGEEWAWAGLPVPASLATSESTRVPLYPAKAQIVEATQPIDFSAPRSGTLEVSEVEDIPRLAPPPRKVSTFSVESEPMSANRSPSNSGCSSSDDGTLPVTPSVAPNHASKNGFFVRHGQKMDNPTHQLALEIGSTDPSPTASPQPPKAVRPGKGTHGRTESQSKFKTFSKRLSGAFGLSKSSPQRSNEQPQPSAGAKLQPTTSRATSGKSRPSLNWLRSQSENSSQTMAPPLPAQPQSPRRTSNAGTEPSTPKGSKAREAERAMSISKPLHPSPKAVYDPPQVANADQCDFPCLYDPASLQNTNSSNTSIKPLPTTPGSPEVTEVGEMGSGIMRPDSGDRYDDPRRAPNPPAISA